MRGSVPERVTIAGAGLAGSLMAVLLGREGSRVDVLERRLDPRQEGAEAGRSINLALSERGLHALGQVGLAEGVLAHAVPLRGRMVHRVDGGLRFQAYGKEGQCINSVSRADLNITLLNAAEQASGVRIRFGQRCLHADLDAAAVTVEDVRTGARESFGADLLLGADGAFSAVRSRMQRLDRFQYRQDYLEHGYKELTIAPAGGGHQLEPNALHIWPRGGFMMMAMANRDGSFTVTLYLPFEGASGFDAIRTEADLLRFFRAEFPDAIPLLPNLAEQYFANPTGSLVTVRSAPWHVGGRVALLGDAAHAVVPFYGQGANASFEDCLVLADCLREEPDRAVALARYQARRKENTDALADLAIENFLEMRDKVASPLFHAKKRFEKLLHTLLPGWFVPLYTMVSFTRVPYAEARTRARRQWRTVSAVLAAILLVALALLLA